MNIAFHAKAGAPNLGTTIQLIEGKTVRRRQSGNDSQSWLGLDICFDKRLGAIVDLKYSRYVHGLPTTDLNVI